MINIDNNLKKLFTRLVNKRWNTLKNGGYVNVSDYVQDCYLIFLKKRNKIDEQKTQSEQYKYIITIINNFLSQKSLSYKKNFVIVDGETQKNRIENDPFILSRLTTKESINIEEYLNREKLSEYENNLINKYLDGYNLKEISSILNENYVDTIGNFKRLIAKIQKQNL